MNNPIKYGRVVGQLDEGELEKYSLIPPNWSVLVPGVERSNVKGVINYRPDQELWVTEHSNGMKVIEGFVGMGGYRKTPKIFYDPTGELLKNVSSRDRIAFTAPQAFEGSTRELGLGNDIAVLAEDVDRYLK